MSANSTGHVCLSYSEAKTRRDSTTNNIVFPRPALDRRACQRRNASGCKSQFEDKSGRVINYLRPPENRVHESRSSPSFPKKAFGRKGKKPGGDGRLSSKQVGHRSQFAPTLPRCEHVREFNVGITQRSSLQALSLFIYIYIHNTYIYIYIYQR